MTDANVTDAKRCHSCLCRHPLHVGRVPALLIQVCDAVAGPSSFMGGFGGGGHMPQMILSHAMGGSLLHDAGTAAPSVVQTGAAGMHLNMSTGLWRDTATSELPPLKRSRLLHQSCPDDMLAAFSEIHDVEVWRYLPRIPMSLLGLHAHRCCGPSRSP